MRPDLGRPGERHHNAVLTESSVRDIRVARAAPAKVRVPLRDLATRYGVSLATICKAARGDAWKHVTSDGGMA